jgi:hypothetical protein
MQLPRDKAIKQRQLGKHVPAATNTHPTIEERCFLCGSLREVITRTVGALRVELCTGGCEERT